MAKLKVSPNVIWALPFFSDLSDNEKEELLKVASFRHCKRNEMIFLHGDRLDYLYWICRGAVQLFRETPDGHELTDNICITGDILFEPDAIREKRIHVMNARAVQDITLLVLPTQWIVDRIPTYNHLANKLIIMFARRAQEARIEAEHQATMNAAQILACFLQHLCIVHNFNPSGFDLPYSKSLIASRLGMELESLSRTLPKLRELGIRVNGKHVSFDDIASVQHYSCGACSVAEECSVHKNMKKLAASNTFRSNVV